MKFLCRTGWGFVLPAKNGSGVLSSGVFFLVEFCPSGVLSVPHVVSWASPIFQKNDFQMLLAVKIVAFINK